MKKERIEITKSNNYIHFYRVCGDDNCWLFSQPFSLSVYEYFKDGRAINEVKSCNYWRRNPRLAKTVSRVLSKNEYIRKEYPVPYNDGKRRYYATTYRDMYAI